MPKIISGNQNVFVPNRHIQENIILVHKLMQTLRRKQGSGGLLVTKIDVEKAYDKVDWGFSLEVLRCFRFSAKWRLWISQCISTTTFSILLNGSPFGMFSPIRGLR